MNKEKRLRRIFSTEFKKEKVALIDEGKLSVKELSEVYEVSPTAIYKWIRKFSKLEKHERIVIEKTSEEKKNKELLEHIKELERVIGKKQLEVDYYKATVEKLQEQQGGDLAKKYRPKL